MNRKIKNEIFCAGLKQWQIARFIGLDEGNFSKKLNREVLQDELIEKIYLAIKKMKKEDE